MSRECTHVVLYYVFWVSLIVQFTGHYHVIIAIIIIIIYAVVLFYSIFYTCFLFVCLFAMCIYECVYAIIRYNTINYILLRMVAAQCGRAEAERMSTGAYVCIICRVGSLEMVNATTSWLCSVT